MTSIPKYSLPLLIAALLLGLGALTSPVWYDDAGHYLVVLEGLETGTFAYPAYNGADADSPFITLGQPLNNLYRWALWASGGQMWGGRVLTILFSLLALGGWWKLGEQIWGASKASWAWWLLLANIQIIVYGSQMLGEMPMLAGIAWAMVGLFQYMDQRSVWGALLAVVGLSWAVFCKAYIALPLGGGLIVAGLWEIGRRDWDRLGRLAGAGLMWVGLVAGYFLWERGGVEELFQYIDERRSYGSEFFALAPREALRYLAFKPLFWLGTAALILRIRVHVRPFDRLLFALQLVWTLAFLLSAGYDRFGFQLLFIPALYLSEYVLAIWQRWSRPVPRLLFLACFILIFAQQTPLILVRRLLTPRQINAHEHSVANYISRHPPRLIYTYDQQLYPFLHPRPQLSAVVPSAADDCAPFPYRTGDLLIAGPYAYTEYQDCIPWRDLVASDTFGDPLRDGYVVLKYR